MSLSNYMERALLDHALGGPNYSRPATVDVALFTVAPNDEGAGGTEVSGGGYSRVSVPNDAANFPAAFADNEGRGRKENGAVINFPDATSNWGTVVAYGYYEGGTQTIMLSGDLATPRQIVAGDPVRANVGSLDITLT